MNVVILGAGCGKRLGLGIPKSLVYVNGKSILEHQVNVFKKYTKNITVVAGYKYKLMEQEAERLNIMIIYNDMYRKHNLLSLEYYFHNNIINPPLIVISGDILIKESIVEKLVKMRGNVLVYDSSIASDDSMKISIKNLRPVRLSKDMEIADGEFITLAKLSMLEETRLIFNEINSGDDYVAELYNILIDRGVKFELLQVCNKDWIEIDTLEDLRKAREVWYDRVNDGRV